MAKEPGEGHMAYMWREHREEMLEHLRKNAWPKAGRITYLTNGKTKVQIERKLKKVAKEADRIVAALEDQGAFPPITDTYLADEQALAKEALRQSIICMRMAGSARDKLQAARQVLDFTKAKPAASSNVQISTAESFLEGLLAKDKADG